MNEPPAPQQIPLPGFIRRSNHQYRWSLWITAGVLLLQATVFAGTAAFLIWTIDWEMVSILDEPPAPVMVQMLQALALLPFVALVLLCVAVCLVRPRIGWHLGLLTESLILLVALQLYFYDRNQVLSERPLLFVYMLGAILIIVFMNSPEGRLLLGAPPHAHETDVHPHG
jgi:hypothetical protein